MNPDRSVFEESDPVSPFDQEALDRSLADNRKDALNQCIGWVHEGRSCEAFFNSFKRLMHQHQTWVRSDSVFYGDLGRLFIESKRSDLMKHWLDEFLEQHQEKIKEKLDRVFGTWYIKVIYQGESECLEGLLSKPWTYNEHHLESMMNMLIEHPLLDPDFKKTALIWPKLQSHDKVILNVFKRFRFSFMPWVLKSVLEEQQCSFLKEQLIRARLLPSTDLKERALPASGQQFVNDVLGLIAQREAREIQAEMAVQRSIETMNNKGERGVLKRL